jgi:hypothetical protein
MPPLWSTLVTHGIDSGVHDSAHHGCCGHVPDVLGGTSAVDHRSAPRGSGGVSGHPGTTSRGLCPE